jgi:repressor LexA
MSNITCVKFPKDIIYINLKEHHNNEDFVRLPLLGSVKAGLPAIAEQSIEDYVSVPRTIIRNDMDGFLLKVKGDSMIDADIHEGDILICQIQATAKNGDIVVAVINNEATVKRFFHEGKRIRLQPENRKYKPIYVESDFMINGKVVGLIRMKD